MVKMVKLFLQKNSPKIYSSASSDPSATVTTAASAAKLKTSSSLIIEKLSSATIVDRRLLLLTLITASSMAILVGIFGAIYSLNQNSTRLKLKSFNITSDWPAQIPIGKLN